VLVGPAAFAPALEHNEIGVASINFNDFTIRSVSVLYFTKCGDLT
jgi:hypothetical protein